MKKNLITRMSAFTLAATMALGGFTVQAAQPEIERTTRAVAVQGYENFRTNLTDEQQAELKALKDQSRSIQKEMFEKYTEYGIAEATFEKDGLTINVATIQDMTKYEISDEEREMILARRTQLTEGIENFVAFKALNSEEIENLKASLVIHAIESKDLGEKIGFNKFNAEGERPHTIAIRAIEGEDLGERTVFRNFNAEGERPHTIATRAVEIENLGEKIEFNKFNAEGERPHTIAIRAVEGEDLGERTVFRKFNTESERPHTIAVRAVEGVNLGERIDFNVNVAEWNTKTVEERLAEREEIFELSENRYEMSTEEEQSIVEELKATLQEKIANLTDEQKAELIALHQQLEQINIAILEKELEFNVHPDASRVNARIEAIRNSSENNAFDIGNFVYPNSISVVYSVDEDKI